jgi:hypothetical protein
MNAATALTIASSTNTGFDLVSGVVVSGVVEEAEDAPVTLRNLTSSDLSH